MLFENALVYPSTVDVQLTVVKIHALTGSFAGHAAVRRWDAFVSWTAWSGDTGGSPASKVLLIHADMWSLFRLPPPPYQWFLMNWNVWHLSLGGYDCSFILCYFLVMAHPCQSAALTAIIFSCFNFVSSYVVTHLDWQLFWYIGVHAWIDIALISGSPWYVFIRL